MLGVILLLLLLHVALAVGTELNSTMEVGSSTCGGNCPGGCDSCPCGTTAQPESASAWCSKFSGWDQGHCQCIMSHESGGNAHAGMSCHVLSESQASPRMMP
jgi:hypothetical protein